MLFERLIGKAAYQSPVHRGTSGLLLRPVVIDAISALKHVFDYTQHTSAKLSNLTISHSRHDGTLSLTKYRHQARFSLVNILNCAVEVEVQIVGAEGMAGCGSENITSAADRPGQPGSHLHHLQH